MILEKYNLWYINVLNVFLYVPKTMIQYFLELISEHTVRYNINNSQRMVQLSPFIYVMQKFSYIT